MSLPEGPLCFPGLKHSKVSALDPILTVPACSWTYLLPTFALHMHLVDFSTVVGKRNLTQVNMLTACFQPAGNVNYLI